MIIGSPGISCFPRSLVSHSGRLEQDYRNNKVRCKGQVWRTGGKLKAGHAGLLGSSSCQVMVASAPFCTPDSALDTYRINGIHATAFEEDIFSQRRFEIRRGTLPVDPSTRVGFGPARSDGVFPDAVGSWQSLISFAWLIISLQAPEADGVPKCSAVT